MINIVVPMAGLGSRFAVEGYSTPKPLIPVHGIPMIRLVIENVKPKCEHRFIFICRQAHVDEFSLNEKLRKWAPNCEVIGLGSLTEGAACTVLTARSLINDDSPLLIVNSDQYIDASIDGFLNAANEADLNGLIMTMKADDPKWSFVGLGNDGLAQRVVEKEVISDCATVGIYYFQRGAYFVQAADAMISREIRVNNEFYVAPVYNEMIDEGARIGVYDIGSVAGGMHGLGVPADLQDFLNLPISLKIVSEINNDSH